MIEMLWLVETMLWLMGGFWGFCSAILFSVDTPDGGIVTFLFMTLAFALGSKVRRKRKAKKEAKRAEKKIENFLSPVAEIDRLRAEMAVLQAEKEMELERARARLVQEKHKREGRRVQCPNCCGTSMVFGRYGTCDYCDSPLTVAEYHEPDTHQKKSYGYEHNAESRRKILEVLRNSHKPMTISQIAEQVTEPMANQKCSALLRQLVDSGLVERAEIQRKAVFFIKGA